MNNKYTSELTNEETFLKILSQVEETSNKRNTFTI